jgi:hypothetical protein
MSRIKYKKERRLHTEKITKTQILIYYRGERAVQCAKLKRTVNSKP